MMMGLPHDQAEVAARTVAAIVKKTAALRVQVAAEVKKVVAKVKSVAVVTQAPTTKPTTAAATVKPTTAAPTTPAAVTAKPKSRRSSTVKREKQPAPVRPVGPIVNNPTTFAVTPNSARYQVWRFSCRFNQIICSWNRISE